jgi:uncharacterized protein (TIGR03435 family)
MVKPWIATIAVFVTLATVHTQGPTFEVASVKPHPANDLLIRTDTEPGGRFLAVNTPLRTLIQLAYGVEDFEILGAPGWAATERFDVNAIAGQELAPLEGPTRGSQPLRLMLQALLKDRFALVAHTETREVQGLALELARADRRPGPRLKNSSTDCAALIAKAKPDDRPPACGFRMSPGSIVLEGLPVGQLASGLAGLLGRRIVDRTGLTANMDLELQWDPPVPTPGGGVATRDGGTSLFAALNDQAGLRLTEARFPGGVLVIESVQRPTPN